MAKPVSFNFGANKASTSFQKKTPARFADNFRTGGKSSAFRKGGGGSKGGKGGGS